MTQNNNTYEGMFVVPAGVADFDRAAEPIRTILERSEAEVLSLKPWDERRFAYEIAKHKRGLYILAYFKAEASRIAEIEHECQLAEGILRVLILRHEHLTDELISAETPATTKAAASAALAAAEEDKSAEAPEESNDQVEALPEEESSEDQEPKQQTQVAEDDDDTDTSEDEPEAQPVQDQDKPDDKTQDDDNDDDQAETEDEVKA